MRKYQKAAVVLAMLGSTGFLGAGVSHAGEEPKFELTNNQSNICGQESNSGIQVSRTVVNVVNAASPQDLSHSTACNNIFGG